MTDAILRGKQVLLCSLRDEDSELLYEWINDRELVSLSSQFKPVSPTAHAAWFERVRMRDDVRIFGVRLLSDDRLVGSCQLHSIHPAQQSAEFQIRLGNADARGRGIGREVLSLMLRYGFEDLGLHRIYLHLLATNKPALRLYRRAGFREEGIAVHSARIDGAWVDIVHMAVLRSDVNFDP